MLEKPAKSPLREHWSGNFGFILAAAGSAIGLGNIWKFPYITGIHGGGAFLLVYLFCIIMVGLPILICEITLGRKVQKSPVGVFQTLSPQPTSAIRSAALIVLLFALGLCCFGKFGFGALFALIAAVLWFTGWNCVGIMGIVAAFFILAFYGVVGGWTLAYFVKGITFQLNISTQAEAEAIFNSLSSSSFQCVFYQLLFMILTGLVVWFGVAKGIERAGKVLMPTLFLMLIVLMLRSLTLPGAGEGVRFLLSPNFSSLKVEGVLSALGHAFFTLSLGMGAMMTYGSYLKKDRNIFTSSLWIVVLDTLIALMAGLVIFPAVFAMGFQANKGPGLVFQVMPLTLNMIGDNLGWFWSSLFFALLAIAALTSAISLLEVCVSFCIDQLHWNRKSSVLISTLSASLLGIGCAVSCIDWSHLLWLKNGLEFLFGAANGNFFDLLDNIASNYMLPLGGLCISLYVGWVWGTKKAVDEIRNGCSYFGDVNLFTLLAGLKDDPACRERYHIWTLATLWGIFIRFIAPIAIIIAFLHSIHAIEYISKIAKESEPVPAVSVQTPESSDRLKSNVPDKISSGNTSDIPPKTSDKTPDKISDKTPDKTPDKISDDTSPKTGN